MTATTVRLVRVACILLLLADIAGARTLKFGFGDPLSSDSGAFAREFKRQVEERSGGALSVRLFPGGALGSETEMVLNARMSALDFAIVGIGNLVPFAEELGALTMPYLIESAADAERLTTGRFAERWSALAERRANVRILGWTHSNFRHLTNSERPVVTLADLRGLKIRVPQSRIMLATYEAWGANPIAMAWPEVFTALQQRVIDGQDNPYIVNHTMKFHEVQDYLTEMRHQYSLQPLIVGRRNFDKFPPEQQAILAAAAAAAQAHSARFQAVESARARDAMRIAGLEIATLADEDNWRRIAREDVWPQFYDSVGGREFFENLVDELAAAREIGAAP